MTVLLATFGTLGDIYPFMAIAKALQRRGYEPLIAAPGMYTTTIEAEGIATAPLRPHQSDIVEALGVDIPGVFRIMLKNPYFILDEIYLRFLEPTCRDIVRAGEGAEIIISHGLLVGAHQAAEILAIPSARVALAPLHLQSARDPSLTPPAPYRPRPTSGLAVRYNTVVRAVVRVLVNLRMRRLRAFRRHVGLPATTEDFFLDFGRANSARKIFGLFSPLFAPPQPDQPANLVVAGFPFFDAADASRKTLCPELEAFLGAGEPPIVFTLGSFAPEVSGDFYDRSLLAARALGRRAVLLAGARDAPRLASRAVADIFVCQQAPHALLFPRSLCVVHHGGIGTTAEAMRAGKPQMIVPFFGDQPDHGVRIERLGLGMSIKLSCYDERSAQAGLRRLLDGEMARTAELYSRLIAAEPGVEAIADWVVETLRPGPERP